MRSYTTIGWEWYEADTSTSRTGVRPAWSVIEFRDSIEDDESVSRIVAEKVTADEIV